jgi:hypothetical protein
MRRQRDDRAVDPADDGRVWWSGPRLPGGDGATRIEAGAERARTQGCSDDEPELKTLSTYLRCSSQGWKQNPFDCSSDQPPAPNSGNPLSGTQNRRPSPTCLLPPYDPTEHDEPTDRLQGAIHQGRPRQRRRAGGASRPPRRAGASHPKYDQKEKPKMHVSRLHLFGHLVMALLAALAFGAIAATAAQAATEGPFWTVEGSGGTQVKLNTNETREVTAKAEGSIALESELFGVKGVVTCPQAEVEKGSYLAGGVPGTSREIVKFFGGCSVKNNGSNCKVKEPITTKPVRNELVVSDNEPGFGPKLLIEFKPETGTEFVKLEFTGTCTLSESKVEGEVLGSIYTDPEASPGKPLELVEIGTNGVPTREALTSYLVKFPDEPKSIWLWNGSKFELKVPGTLKAFGGSGSAKLTGSILVSLVNGKKYGSEV